MNDYRSHLSVTVWTTLMVLALGALINLPERVFSADILGSQVSLVLTAELLVGLVGVAVVCSGLEAAIRTHPKRAALRHTYRYWGLPGAIVMTAAALLPAAAGGAVWAALLGGTGVILAAALLAEYHRLDPEDRHYQRARWLLNLLVYVVAIVAFVLIYSARSRSLVSSTLIGGIAGLLALDILRGANRSQGLTLLYAVTIALIMAQSTWVLNYWPFLSLRVGLILLIEFYLLVGLIQQELLGRLSSRRAAEYLTLAAGVTALVLWFRP